MGKYLTTKEIEEEGFEDIMYIKGTKTKTMNKKINVMKKKTGKKYNTKKKEKSLKIKGNKNKKDKTQGTNPGLVGVR